MNEASRTPSNEHHAAEVWWGQLDHLTIQRYPRPSDALKAEAIAILTEHPLYNKAGTVPRKRHVQLKDITLVVEGEAEHHRIYPFRPFRLKWSGESGDAE